MQFGFCRAQSAVLAAVTLSMLVVSCSSCEKKTDAPPTRFISGDAQAVVEIRDIGLAVRLRNQVSARLSKIVSAEQIASLSKELTLTLGFDPSSPEGLKKAGLRTEGSIAVEVVRGGAGALWVIPINDAKAFGGTLKKVVEARVQVDEVKQEKVGGTTVEVFGTAFGDKTTVVAAWAAHQGYALVAAGRDGLEQVTKALSLKEEASIGKSAKYSALVERAKGPWEARVISLNGGPVLRQAMRQVSQLVPQAGLLARPELEDIKATVITVNAKNVTLDVKAFAELGEKGQLAANKLFTTQSAAGRGVVAVDVTPAVVYAQVAGNPQALLDLLAPAGSPSRQKVDAIFGRMKTDIETDFEKEVLPLLTGHGAAALGIGDLSQRSFAELANNPRGVLWTAFGLGVADETKVKTIEKRLDPGLKGRQLEIVERKVAEIPIRSVKPKEGVALVETMTHNGAWLFSNESTITDLVAQNQAAPDLLKGKPGLALELRFRTLARSLSTFRIGSLPVLYRSILAKALDALNLLDSLRITAGPTDKGLKFEAQLSLIPELGAANTP